MTYPAGWSTGDVMGRNLVTHPKFPAGSTAKGAWSAEKTSPIADKAGTYAGAGILAPCQITLDTLTVAQHAGAAVTVRVQLVSTQADGEVRITGTGAMTYPAAGNDVAVLGTVDQTTNTGYVWRTITGTLPPPDARWRDSRGVVSPTTYDLVFDPGSGAMRIGAVRVDFEGSPVAGYVDGDGAQADLTGFEATWDTAPADGTFAATTITATADGGEQPASTVTIDPVPAQSWTAGEPVSLALTGTTTHTDPALSWTLEAGTLPAGVTLDAAGTIAGTPEAEAAGTATIGATDLAGSSATLALEWSVAAADTGGDTGGNMDDLADTLAPLIAAFVGKPGKTATTEQARASVPIVAEFVRAYTRGNGWTGDAPDGPIRAVIVSATARLVMNPAQVASYQMADYSERPAVLNGYTLAEQGVLHNYRRRQA